MGTIVLALRVLFAVIGAVVVRVARRLVAGPAVAGWPWSVELAAVSMRAMIMAALHRGDRRAEARLQRLVDPPLPRPLKGVMHVEPTKLGGHPTEHHQRVASDLTDQATILYLHGGGYVSGSAATHRRWIAQLTWATGSTAYALDYRLAPAHPFPAALDDATAAYRELVDGGLDPAEIFLAGDSAGGGLALALMLRLRDEGDDPPAGAILFSPYTDLEHTGASIEENLATDYLPVLPVRHNVEYLAGHDPRDPYASPLHGDFTGIPPMMVFAGGREMIRDDSTRLVERVRRFGGEIELHVAPDMFHVWPALLPNHPETLRALALSDEFVRDHTKT
jgi:acetyl esterase/lipase